MAQHITLAAFLVPVSYTHLRNFQAFHQFSLRFSFVVVAMQMQDTCLLYTSRCV